MYALSEYFCFIILFHASLGVMFTLYSIKILHELRSLGSLFSGWLTLSNASLFFCPCFDY